MYTWAYQLFPSVCVADAAPGHFQMNHSKTTAVTSMGCLSVDYRRSRVLLSAVRGNYEEGATVLPRKHDFARTGSENWRSSRDDQNGEDEEGGWRLAGSRRDGDRWCPPSPGDSEVPLAGVP